MDAFCINFGGALLYSHPRSSIKYAPVDLGTEFTIKVGPNLQTDVQVFEGAVVATGARSGFPSRMEAGTASRFSLEATLVPLKLEFSESRFLRHISKDVKPGVPLPESLGARISRLVRVTPKHIFMPSTRPRQF